MSFVVYFLLTWLAPCKTIFNYQEPTTPNRISLNKYESYIIITNQQHKNFNIIKLNTNTSSPFSLTISCSPYSTQWWVSLMLQSTSPLLILYLPSCTPRSLWHNKILIHSTSSVGKRFTSPLASQLENHNILREKSHIGCNYRQNHGFHVVCIAQLCEDAEECTNLPFARLARPP